MLSWLKDHPFSVDAFFESSLVLTYAIPKHELLPLIPECLELDTLNDQYAFVAVAMVQTKALRPKGFPQFMGNDFFLMGYRIFVRYVNNEGKRLRGLYIIKSETDKKKMEFFGNLFTHYNYTTTDVAITKDTEGLHIQSLKSGLNVKVDEAPQEVSLPPGSPFADWKEARRFAGPLPFTFTYDAVKKEVLIIEGVRQNWKPEPVRVVSHKIAYLDSLKFKQVQLANAFIIHNIPYYWKKGKKEQWNP